MSKPKKIPTFARNRELSQQAPYTKTLKVIRKYFLQLSEEDRERFYCLVADVARITAWGAGHRSWQDLMRTATRYDGEEFGPAVRRMGLSESLASPLWLIMRSTKNAMVRHALGLVFVRLQLGIAWVHTRIMEQKEIAGGMIEEAFAAAELHSDEVAELTAEDFVIGDWAVGGELFTILETSVFSRSMDRFTVLTEDNAYNDTLRQVFDVDDMLADGRGHSPSHDPTLRNVREIGVKGAFHEMRKLFGEEIALDALKRHDLEPDAWQLVEQPMMMNTALTIWAERYEPRVAEVIGADSAHELLKRCLTCFAFGRAITPAFILLSMAAQKRWETLAGDAAEFPSSAMDKVLEHGGSWPSILPPEAVEVRSVSADKEPTQKEVDERNRWNGREISLWVAIGLVCLMFYGWYASLDQDVNALGMLN